MRIIAILIRSAAVPCSGVFTAVRSANDRAAGIAAVHVRDRPLAPEQRLRHARLATSSIVLSMNSLHPGVALEVALDVPLGFLAVDAQRLREPERRLSVNDPEVHRLGARAACSASTISGIT